MRWPKNVQKSHILFCLLAVVAVVFIFSSSSGEPTPVHRSEIASYVLHSPWSRGAVQRRRHAEFLCSGLKGGGIPCEIINSTDITTTPLHVVNKIVDVDCKSCWAHQFEIGTMVGHIMLLRHVIAAAPPYVKYFLLFQDDAVIQIPPNVPLGSLVCDTIGAAASGGFDILSLHTTICPSWLLYAHFSSTADPPPARPALYRARAGLLSWWAYNVATVYTREGIGVELAGLPARRPDDMYTGDLIQEGKLRAYIACPPPFGHDTALGSVRVGPRPPA